MPQPIKCIIVDDDEIDRLSVFSHVRQYPSVQVLGMYASAMEALEVIENQLPDIVFLDVDMPGITGLQLRQRLMNIPVCVFITAYADYAVESFELEALDFIVKPITAERFEKTMNRITEYLTIKHKASLLDYSLGANTLFIKNGHQQLKINLHDVIYLEALKDYTSIVTTNEKHCVLSTLGNLLLQPGFQSFVRIHKSYAVQKHFIERIHAQEVVVKNISLPVGRVYKEALSFLKSNNK